VQGYFDRPRLVNKGTNPRKAAPLAAPLAAPPPPNPKEAPRYLRPFLRQLYQLCDRIGMFADQAVSEHGPVPPRYLDAIRREMPSVRVDEIHLCVAAAFHQRFLQYEKKKGPRRKARALHMERHHHPPRRKQRP
jgi:hypothetical protein